MVVGFYKAWVKGWDGKTWVDLGQGPPDMYGNLYLAFDQNRDQLVLHAAAPDAARTWTYAKGKWTRVATGGPRSQFSAFAYDPRSKTTVLFGADCFDAGFSCPGERDTWSWDGSSWKQLHPSTSPPKGHSVMTFDAATNQMILLASDHSMWTWGGSDWRDLHTPAPSLERYWSLVYDIGGKQLV